MSDLTPLEAVQGVLDLMRTSSLPKDEWDEDVILPYTNGYSMWFIGAKENYTDTGHIMYTAPLSAQEILDKIETRKRDG